MSELKKKAHRILGALVLGGTADALGWRNESAQVDKHKAPIDRLQAWTKRVGRVGGYWDKIEPGEYSDDTQLTLAVARCISPEGDYDADRFTSIELPYWLSYERGGGRTIRAAARNVLQRRNVTWDTNVFDGYYESGANGAAMRVFPLSLIPDPEKMRIAVWKNAVSTHGHPRAILGALVMATSLHRLLDREAKDSGLNDFNLEVQRAIQDSHVPDEPRISMWANRSGDKAFRTTFEKTRTEMKSLLQLAWDRRHDDAESVLRQMGCLDKSTKGSGTGCVAAAHYFFYKHEREPLRAVVEAANAFGSDTDTIAKLVGDLFGCLYGRAAYENGLTERLCNRFYLLTITRYLIGTEAPHWFDSSERNETDLTTVKEGDEYFSHVFGPGIVSALRKPFSIRKGTAILHQAKVDFQCGIVCTFSHAMSVSPEQGRIAAHEDFWTA